jgi:hypothetical protein
MISKKYINDAFILHDETFKFEKTNDFIYFNATKNEVQSKNSDGNIFASPESHRDELNTEWAYFKNTFKYQPLFKIRNYFGETVALYFAWCGTLISSLWLISLIGIIFFLIELSKSIQNEKNSNSTTNSNDTYEY